MISWFKFKKKKDISQKENKQKNESEKPVTLEPVNGSKVNPKNVNKDSVKDPEESKRKRTLLIKWFLALILLGGLITIFYFACAPTSRYISSISNIQKLQEDSKNYIQITTKNGDNETNYKINIDNEKNYWSQIYFDAGSDAHYIVYANSDHGTISFQVVQRSVADSITYIVNGLEFQYQKDTQDVANWLNQTITKSSGYSTGESWWMILLNMLPLIIFIILIVWSVRRFGKLQGSLGGDENGVFGIGKSNAKVAVSNVKFSDVAGIEEEKTELIEIVDYLKNPDKYAAMGARTPRGVILYGPPGTGKTLLAKAVAGEANVPFFQASGSAFEDMLVGVGAKRVRDLFAKAKKAAPSIIFIDEIDSVASKRGKMDIAGGGSGLADQTINQLLAEMDGFNTKTGVVVMAATNRLDVLDSAILRPGRFDRHIQVSLPDIKERIAILKIHARNKNISSKVSLDDVARRTPGFSGAQLENVLNEATLLAVRLNKTVVSMEEIDEAIDRVIAGPAKKSRVISEVEKRQIAYHEAGHALVGLNIPGSDVVEKITIIPRGYAAGYTLSTPEKQELAIQKKSDLLGMISTTLGGRAAEEVVYGKEAISTGAINDLYKVTNVARAMVAQLGMSDVGMTQFIPSEGQNSANIKLYSETTALKIDQAVEKIIKDRYTYSKKIISKNRKELDLIVEALLLLETIVKKQIDYIHKYKKLPEEALERKKTLAKEKANKKASEKIEKSTKKTTKNKSNKNLEKK